MIRFYHDFYAIKFIAIPNYPKYCICKLSFIVSVINPEIFDNCIFEIDSSQNMSEYFSTVEEAQMNAAILNLTNDNENTYLPVISNVNISKFKQAIHVFPINQNTTRSAAKQLIEKLDIFKHLGL